MDLYAQFKWALAVRNPVNVIIFTGVLDQRPEDILAELREEDPEGYALLTEHLDIAAPSKDKRP